MTRRRALLASAAFATLLGLAAHAVAQAEAERRLDAALDRFRAVLPPGSTFEMRGRTVDPVTGVARLTSVLVRDGESQLVAEEVTLRDLDDDRVGAATVRGLRLTGPARSATPAVPPAAPPTGGKGPAPGAAPAAASGALTIAQTSLTNLRLPGAGGTGPAAVNWAEAAVESAVMEAVAFEAPDPGAFTLGRVTLSNYAPGRIGEATLEGLRFTEDPSKGQGRMALGRARLANATIPRIGADADPWTLTADTALIEGAELDLPGERITFRLGRLEVEGWGEGRLTRAALAGLAFAGPGNGTVGDFDLRAGRLEFSGFPMYNTARAMARNVAPPSAAPTRAVSGMAQGLSATFSGRQVVAIGGMRLESAPMPNDPTAQAGTMTVEGISLDLPPEAGGSLLSGLGYRALTGRIDVTSTGSEASRTLTADPLAITADNMGRLELRMDIRNWSNPPAGSDMSDSGQALARMAEWQLASFAIRYADAGLLPRVFAQQAREQRVPEARLRDQYAQMTLQTPLPEGRDPNATRLIRQAVANFIRNPGTIEIAMRPPQPLAFGALMGVSGNPSGDLVRELGLTARAFPPGATPGPAAAPAVVVPPAAAAPGAKPAPAGATPAPARPVQPAPRPVPAPPVAPGKPAPL
ncbi:hypothetical protein ACE7GA_16855 [Roseomonas sp. CCTCC AB2023176]|uniref:hypothetical protein n=1 Tax=Roseomonas sp. CCTCC AB2023176 TaxID=3342640 RepID=UPI0035DECA78